MTPRCDIQPACMGPLEETASSLFWSWPYSFGGHLPTSRVKAESSRIRGVPCAGMQEGHGWVQVGAEMPNGSPDGTPDSCRHCRVCHPEVTHPTPGACRVSIYAVFVALQPCSTLARAGCGLVRRQDSLRWWWALLYSEHVQCCPSWPPCSPT